MRLHEAINREQVRVAFGMRRGGGGPLAVVTDPDSVSIQSGQNAATIPAATQAAAGVLSAADKSKLDGLSGSAPQFASRAALLGMNVPADVPLLRTGGFAAPGDGGDGLYLRVPTAPAHAAMFSTADGSWWELVPDSGGVRVRQLGATGDGAIDDAQAILDADALGGGIDFGPGTYRIASDLSISGLCEFRMGAVLVPDAGVRVHLAAGYLADDWTQCFDVSAAGSSVTGDRAPRGYVTPQHWGADPTDTSIDDMPAIEAATEYATLRPIRNEYAEGFPVKFPHPGAGNYYLTRARPIYVARTTHWFGDARIYLRDYGGVEIRAADGLDAVVFAFFPGGASAPAEYETVNAAGDPTPGIGKAYSGLRSRFTDLAFLPEPSATVRQGLVHNVVCYVERCVASGFTEAQFHAHAQTSGSIINAFAAPGVGNTGNTDLIVPASTLSHDGTGAVFGNVNGSIYTGCYASNGVAAAGATGGSHGFVAHGNNAGTVKYIGCDANGNQGAGFLENSSIGCELFGCHTAQNCRDIEHDGVRYLCIRGHVAAADSEPGVGAAWRTYWAVTSSVAGDSAWASGTYYHPSGGVNVCSPNSRTSIEAHYSEGGIEVGVIARNHTKVNGGNACERTPWHGEFGGAYVQPVAGLTSSPHGYVGETTPGDDTTEYGVRLGVVDGYATGALLSFGDRRDDAVNGVGAMELSWNAIRGRYEWVDDSSNRPVSGWSGNGFSGVGYAAVAQAYPWANGIYIGDGSAAGLRVNRHRAAVNLTAISDAAYGAAVRGDIWWYTQPVAGGKIGAVCTTGGTIGVDAVIREFGSVDP